MRELFLILIYRGAVRRLNLLGRRKGQRGGARGAMMMGVALVDRDVGVSVHYIIAIKTTTSTQLTSFLIMLFVQNSVQK